MTNENKPVEFKECKKCGRMLPIDNFRLIKGNHYVPYYLGQCKMCEYEYQREYLGNRNKIRFSDNLEILIKRKYKEIKKERILSLANIGIELFGTDEIFIKLMDYKNS